MSPTAQPIYLDYNATTPLDPQVRAAMEPFFCDHFGNAASLDHDYGAVAARAVERARVQAAELIGASAAEIIWTSGATESCNLALLGLARRASGRSRRIVTQATEHPAVLDPCRQLKREGFEVTTVGVDGHGVVDLQALADALPGALLVTIMMANNETGTLQPIAAVAEMCRDAGVWLHCDAAQAYGRIPIDLTRLAVDLLSASGHKIHGPKGVGLLWLRRRQPAIRLEPLLHGGGHEHGLRSGTLNVPAIVGFGAAAELCARQQLAEATRLTRLRDRLLAGLQERLGDVRLNGHPSERLPNTLHVSFPGIAADELIQALDGLAISRGAACTSADPGPSHVLRAMNLPPDRAYSAVRCSLGRPTDAAQIEQVIDRLATTVAALRRRTDSPTSME